jgi:DNA-binding XRE family transcriptional regulator
MMERTEIKILMLRKKVTQAAIARKLDIKPSTVCNVIKGTATSARVKRAIAQALGMRIEDLWPNDHERAA